MIGTASFTRVFMIGPFVKFPSIPQIPSFVLFFADPVSLLYMVSCRISSIKNFASFPLGSLSLYRRWLFSDFFPLWGKRFHLLFFCLAKIKRTINKVTGNNSPTPIPARILSIINGKSASILSPSIIISLSFNHLNFIFFQFTFNRIYASFIMTLC